MVQRTMAAQLGNLQFLAARAEMAARLEKTTLKSLLGNTSAREAATFWAVQKVSALFAKIGIPFSRLEKVIVWQTDGVPQEVAIKAGPSEWKFSIPLFEKVAEEVVKPMPVATPKRADGTPAVIITRESVLAPTPKVAPAKQPDAQTPVARKGTCEACPEGMAAFAVEAKGKGLRALCTGCHEAARKDKASFVEAIAI